ncbi:MAG: sigma-70 family RNA polymerase sigma factor [Terriglobia bacterium]
MSTGAQQARFEEALLPHLDAAYNLARWLTGNAHDAEDMVQEAFLRALEHFDGFHGESARGWILAIVRNTCFTWLSRRGRSDPAAEFDEELHSVETANPESLMIREADSRQLAAAMERLSEEYREAIVLREMEGMSYKEIADITGVPIGTVMSRLARARVQLQRSLLESAGKER